MIRLVGAILLDQDDEWAVAERRYFNAESMNPLGACAVHDRAGDSGVDRVGRTFTGVGACEKPGLWLFQEAVGGALPSTASSASMPSRAHDEHARISTTCRDTPPANQLAHCG